MWSSDYSVTRAGWEVCARAPPPPPTPHYTLMNNALSWGEADAACLAAGLQLATVQSAAQNAALVTAAAGNQVWIGGTDAASEGAWVWSPSNTPLSYTNWYAGEPNNANGGEDCLQFNYKIPGKWNDWGCFGKRKYVCQPPLPPPSPPPPLSPPPKSPPTIEDVLLHLQKLEESHAAELIAVRTEFSTNCGCSAEIKAMEERIRHLEECNSGCLSPSTPPSSPPSTPPNPPPPSPPPPEPSLPPSLPPPQLPSSPEPTCRAHEGSVWSFCYGAPSKKWGVGPEGVAIAILNCKSMLTQLCPPPPPLPPAYPGDLNAWYCPGGFDIASNTWQDCSGNGNTAALSGSGLVKSRSAGHGATSEVLALSGSTSSEIAFGAVIKSEFTVCSVTRYTGGAKGRILQGSTNWLHGHRRGAAGVANYEGWKTARQNNVSPNTDWVVMCGSNAGSQLKLVNGRDVGTATGGPGDQSLFVNAGRYPDSKSDFAIAELVVWPRGLTDEEMRRASDHLIDRLGMSI